MNCNHLYEYTIHLVLPPPPLLALDSDWVFFAPKRNLDYYWVRKSPWPHTLVSVKISGWAERCDISGPQFLYHNLDRSHYKTHLPWITFPESGAVLGKFRDGSCLFVWVNQRARALTRTQHAPTPHPLLTAYSCKTSSPCLSPYSNTTAVGHTALTSVYYLLSRSHVTVTLCDISLKWPTGSASALNQTASPTQCYCSLSVLCCSRVVYAKCLLKS